MGFLDRILGLFYKRENAKNNNPSDESQQPQNENAAKLLECGGFFASLLDQDKYIAKSEYKDKRDKYAPVIDFFTVLRSSDMLEDFSRKNGLDTEKAEQIIESYNSIETQVEKHNEDYVSAALVREKEYLDKILHSVDPRIALDEDQRRVVLTDEDYCLVIAGAGAGKTTTVAAKVKYLVDKQGVDPRQILVI